VTEGTPGGFAAGSRIAGYLLEEQIGSGGMAVVFRAHDERLDRTVALKIMAPMLASDDAFRQRFIRESRAAAAVDDPHIIPVFEAGEAAGVLFIAMRYVRGGDARSAAGGALMAPGRAAEMVSQVAQALDAAHARGLVHRDVKPANILLDAGGGAGRPDHVYLSDFGLSKGSLQQSGLTGTGTFLGTLDYVAPEQIAGQAVDGRADQYSLACAAFELLSGTPPFARAEPMAVMYAQLSDPPPSVHRMRRELPPAVDAVFIRALAKTPDERYPSCREFADALRHALGLRPYDSGPSVVLPHPSTRLIEEAEQTRPATPGGGRVDNQGAPPTAAAGLAGAAGTMGAAGAGGPGGPGAATVRASAGSGGRRGTSPDQTVAQSRGTYVPALPGPRPWWRTPFALAAALLILIAAAGTGAFLAVRGTGSGGGGGGGGGGGHHHVAALTIPGCGAATATSRTVHVRNKLNPILDGSHPFGLAVTPDGKFVFAVTGINVEVFAASGLRLTMLRSYPLLGVTTATPAAGATLTEHGKILLVAIGNGIDVLNVAAMETATGTVDMGTLTVPNLTGYGRGVQVAATWNGRFAYVALQFRSQVAVFNLQQAVSTGNFSSGVYLGSLNVGAQPVGVTLSPGDKTLYIASFGAADGQGALSVVSVGAAQHPATAAIKQVKGLCNPARIAVAGGTVWVTTRQANYLLGFSAAKLLTEPSKALTAKVLIGQAPVGLVATNGGSRLIAADTTGSPTLAVVNPAGKATLLGFLTSGQGPHEFALSRNGRFLYVADHDSAQLQVIDLSKLP
jgi:DNA-binding beta-propeller fold protein YncE